MDIDWFNIVVLPIVQGIGEFLPISSSGHLVLFKDLYGERPDNLQTVVLHFGTLLSILVFYRTEIWRILTRNQHLVLPIIVGSIPTAIIGLGIKKYCYWVTEYPMLAALMLPVTGVLLLTSARVKAESPTEYDKISLGQALFIGICQGLAILPGLSRSGTTIAAALFVKVRRDAAATFSFLLSVPAVAGATLLELKDCEFGSISEQWGSLIVGPMISFVVGLVALATLTKMLQRDKLQYFAFWVIPVGLIFALYFVSTGKYLPPSEPSETTQTSREVTAPASLP